MRTRAKKNEEDETKKSRESSVAEAGNRGQILRKEKGNREFERRMRMNTNKRRGKDEPANKNHESPMLPKQAAEDRYEEGKECERRMKG